MVKVVAGKIKVKAPTEKRERPSRVVAMISYVPGPGVLYNVGRIFQKRLRCVYVCFPKDVDGQIRYVVSCKNYFVRLNSRVLEA